MRLDASKAYRRVPAGFHIQEIFTGRAPEASEILSWKRFFMLVDKTIKVLESSGIRRNRQKALEAATNWMLAHLEGSEGLGAIYPAMMNSIMALTQLGNGTQHPMLQQQIKHLDDLILEDEKGFRVQPCHSPVWDTAMTAYAIGSTQRVMSEPAQWALNRAADWLLDRQAKRRGDWAIRNPAIEPGGWYFEYANEFYPDTDDTAKVLLALEWASASDTQLQQEAETRALKWLVSMQSSDGGWAAFDVDNCARILTQVPFADHNAMLDPTCADITGRVLEALSGRNRNQDRGAIEKGVRYLLQSQQPDGSWYGRWGVNYLYGTCFALRGLRAAGTDPSEASMICGAEWIRSIQNSDGGWGETATSYDDSDCKNIGDSTPSQTAWALLALFATNDYLSSSVKAGVNYLLFTQNQQGTWQEEPFIGTGFPGVFYLRYHMYPQYFPLIALGEYLHQDRWESR